METKKAIQKNQGNKRYLFWMRIEIDTEPINKKKGRRPKLTKLEMKKFDIIKIPKTFIK
jgi:hypothetical protein